MKRKYRRVSALLIVFSLWWPIYTGYLGYESLTEVDLLSPALIFENSDPVDLLAGLRGQVEFFLPGIGSAEIPARSGSVEPLSHFLPILQPLSQQSFPIRC